MVKSFHIVSKKDQVSLTCVLSRSNLPKSYLDFIQLSKLQIILSTVNLGMIIMKKFQVSLTQVYISLHTVQFLLTTVFSKWHLEKKSSISYLAQSRFHLASSFRVLDPTYPCHLQIQLTTFQVQLQAPKIFTHKIFKDVYRKSRHGPTKTLKTIADSHL